jgi:hypothetical protein
MSADEKAPMILGSDAARAIGRFRPEGPLGYRAKSLPDGPLRATRVEAEADERAHREGEGRGEAQVETYGMCTACGFVEVALNRVTGTRNLADIGESAAYPTGYGCEVCA